MVRFLTAALPSVGALVFFVIGLRALVHADRRERAAEARYERAAHPVPGNAPDGAGGVHDANGPDDAAAESSSGSA
ncbi:MAG: hypothetical protein U0Q19_03170 [Kineosporiaceae bacterium]